MDGSNFQNYRSGRQHWYYGGLVKKSPFRLEIPSSGHWHVTVDMQGLQARVRSGIKVFAGVLPEARVRPLSEIPSLVRKNDYDTYGGNSKEIE